MKAAVHLGPNYIENLEVYRNTNYEELQKLFDITERLILDHQAEILSVSQIDWTAPLWTRSTPMHDQVITWSKAKVHVYSDSVSCFEGAFRSDSKNGKINFKNFQQSNSYRELFRFDGEPIEFEWSISQDVLHWRSSRRSRNTCKIETLIQKD